MSNPTVAKSLYNALTNKGYTASELGDESTFISAMDNADNRKELYDMVRSDGYDLGEYDAFEGRFTPQPTNVEQPAVEQPTAVPEPMKSDTIQPIQPIAQPTIVAQNESQTNGDYAIGLKQGLEQGWKGLKEGARYFVGETANVFTGSSEDEQRAIEAISRLEEEGVNIADYAQPLSKSLEKVYKRGIASSGDNISTLTETEQEQVRAILEENEIKKTIADAIKEAGGDLDKAKQLLSRAATPTWGDRIKADAADEMSKMKPTKGFGAWVGNLIPQMIPSAAAMALSAVTKNPKYAKLIGHLGMGTMTASTAGQSMKEARDAGASGSEVWAVGIADGIIEYATEKIPFDRYTTRLFNGTKRKVGQELANAVVDNNSPARNELEKLLAEANKKLGGKLLNGKTVKDYATDVLAEGASEFTAEALQTITPMIYENPDDYPTITEILQNGWEGAKAGLFMGSVLGGASKIAEHQQQRSRRQQQGFVDVAQVQVKDDGTAEVGEVIGVNNENGNLSLLIDGKVQEFTPESVKERHRFTFEEFDKGVVQMEQDESFDNGAALETPQEKNDAQNMFEYQQQQMRQYFGLGEDGDVDAFLGDDPIAGLQRVAANDQEAGQVVLDYLNAKATVDGVFQRMSDDAEAKIAEADAIIASRTNRNNGLIQRVRLKNDKQAYVLSGDIVMTDDGDMVNASKSSESLVVIDAITGKKEYTYPSNIAEVYQSVDAETERQTLREQVIDEYSQKLADDMNGTLAFAPGDNYTLVDDQGAQHNVQIVADNGDGTVAVVEVMPDGVQQEAVMAKSTIQEMSDTHNQLRLGKYLQDKKAQEIAIAEQEKQAEQPDVVAEEQQQQPVSALSQVPTNENGKHDFNQVSPDVAWSAIVEMTGGAVDDALDTAKQMQKQSNDALKAAQKEKPKVGTDVESIIANKNAHKEKVNGLQAIADHWANIVALGELSAQQNEQTEEVVTENVVAEEAAPVAEQIEVTPEVAPVAEVVVEPVAEQPLVDHQGNPIDANGQLIVDIVESVDELSDDDFNNPTRSIQLPKLPKAVDDAIGADGKPIIIKKNIFERNLIRHSDVTPEEGRLILNAALYNPNIYGQNQKERKPYNWVVVSVGGENGSNKLVLLEVNKDRERVEVVHWHFINQHGLEKLKRQAEREDGQLLILPSETSEEVGALSDPTLNQPSESKDTTTEPITQEVEQENLQPTPENAAEEQMEVATEQPKSETVEPTPRGAVDMDTLQLTMSDEEFNSLLDSGDVERMNGYLKELDDTLVINDQSPFKGQQELREEFKRLKDQYGGEDNIPTDVMEDINARYKPYAELSQKVYDRKYALEDRLRSAEVQATQTAKKEEVEVKETHQVTAFNGFLADKTKLGASNAEKALSKKVKIEDKNYTIAEYVEQAVQSGTIELRTSEVPKYKGVSRRKWNQMDAAQQQAEQERIKNGGTVTEYYINDYNLGKTAYDYAQYLQAKAEAQKAAEPEWLQKVPTDGRNFMVYTKVAGENNYSATDLKTGQAVGLVYASLVKRDRLQSLVEELPKVLLEGAHFQIRDTNGKIYYSSEPIAPTKGKKKATTKLTTLKTVSGAEVKVPINLYKYVSTDKTRAYTGVYFDPEGFVVATDGHNMIAVKHDVAEADAEKFISKAGDVASTIFNWRIANPKPNTEKPMNVDFVDVEKQIGGKAGDKFVVFEIDGQEVGFPPKAIHVLADFQRAFGGQAFVGDMTAGKAIVIRSGDNYAIALQTTKYADLSQAIHIPSGIEQTTEQVEQPATVSEQAQQPTEPVKQEPKPKRTADRKIEDYGEKIAGARKDILRNMSKNFDNATIESLVALPFAKAFVKPDLKKLVEAGVLRPDDAKYAEAIMWVYINKNKPKARKTDEWAAKRGRETRITAWAKKTFDGITRLRDFIEADEATRDELIAQYGQLGEQIKAEENAYRNSKVGQFNAAANGYGDLYSPNPIEVIVAALDKLNYQAGDKITFDAPIVKAEYLGRFYNFENQDGEKVYAFNRADSIEEAIDTLVLQAKIRRGDTDIQYPTYMFSIIREDPIKEPSGMFTVFHINKRGSLISETVEGREAAEKKVADYQSQGLSADLREEKKVVGYATHRIRFKNRLTDVETIFDEKFGSEGEARQALEERYDEFNDLANDYVASLSKQKREQPVPFEVTSLWNSETKAVKYVVKNTETGDVMSPQLDTRKEAEEYYKNHIEEWKAKWQEMKDARKKFVFFDDNVKPREGKDYRNGRDVTVEDLATTFGFRGIQFGNWTNDADRQAALNQAYDAFMDLADILGVSPKALSLAGELGIAFGARGGGSALAHYEPDEIVINLTKTKGAGSLAHEWWHALDNYFSRQGNIPMGFVTSNPTEAKMREEMRAAWQGVVKAVKGTEYAKRSMAQGNYWGNMLEMTARLFGEWTVYELAKTGRTNHFLSRGITPSRFDMWRRINYAAYKWSLPEDQTPMPFEEFALLPRSLKGMPFPTKEETEQMGEAVRNLFDVVQEKVDEQGNVVLFQRGDFPEMPNTEANRRAYNLVREKLQNAGIKVHEVSEEMADAMTSLTGAQFAAKRKSAPETASVQQEHQPTVVSSADGAKILKDLDSAITEYENKSSHPKTLLGDIAKVLNAKKRGSNSQYATFEAVNGKVFTIRLANHNAKTSTFDNHNEDEGISIVVTAQDNTGITNNGNAHLVEFFYDAIKLRKADGKPLVEILKSIKQALYSGEYVDTTGLAEREEVNLSDAEYQIVYRGSGAKFDRVELFQDSQGKIYGWAVGGEIYLTPDGLNANTAIHEYSHLWVEAMRKKDSKKWGEIKSQLKATPFWQQVLDDPNYENIRENEEAVASEVLARLSGNKGAERLANEAQRILDAGNGSLMARVESSALVQHVKRLLRDFYAWVSRNVFGITNEATISRVADMVVDDLLDEVALDNIEESPYEAMVGNKQEDTDDGVRYRSDVDEVFDIDFAELESEYQQLDKNDEQAMAEWRAKKKRVVEDYLNYMTDDLALPASVFIYDHNDKGSLDEAVRLIAEVVADKLGENVEELYLPDHKKDLDEFTDAIAAFTEVGRIINGRGMYNVGRAVDNNEPLSWFGAVVHENAHHLLEGKHTEQEFADIWNEAVENEAPIVSKIQEHYATETNATKGEEVVAFAVGGYAGSKHTHIFASYIKGDGEVSLDDIVKKLNKSLPLRNELVIEVLNDLRNEYQRREAEVNTDRGNQEANREREAARKGQESGERSSRQDSAQIPEQESHRYVGGDNAEGYGQFGYNLNAIATAAEELAGQLHTPIRIIGDVSDINDDDLNTRRRKRSYKGWYDVSTGEVVVVAPNATSVADVQRTVIHEVVAHNGLRELFGADFDTFLDNVYRNVDEPIRHAIANLAARKGWDFRVATEEYLASLAETTNFEEIEKQGWWQKIKDYFMDLLRKVGIKLAKPLTNDELRYILWRSYQMQTSKGAMAVAEDVDMQRKLGVGNFRTRQSALQKANEQFNRELQEYIENGAKPNTLFHIGMPQGVMQNFLPDLPIVMRPRILNKASRTKHNVEVSALRNLPSMISEPIFVFNREDGKLGVLTEIKDRDGKNVCIAIEMNKTIQDGKSYLEVNDIITIHGREVLNIIQPIVYNNTLRYVDKKKGLDWLSSASYNYQQEIDSKDLDSATKIVEDFDNSKYKTANNVPDNIRAREGSDMIADDIDYDAGSMTFEESITNGLIKLAQERKDNAELKMNAIRAIGGNLSKLRKAMTAQRKYDQAMVDSIIRIAKMAMNSGFFTDMSRAEVSRLLTLVNKAASSRDITNQARDVVDMLIKHQVKEAKTVFEKLLKVRGAKVDSRGIIVQGKLDSDGQRMVAAFKEGIKLDPDTLQERIDQVLDEMGSDDSTIAANASVKYQGLMLAQQYVNEIRQSEIEEAEIKRELQEVTEAKILERDDYAEFVESVEDAIRENRLERIEAYNRMIIAMGEGMNYSIKRAKKWREEQKERVQQIHHDANSDLQGIPTDEHSQLTWKQKIANNGLLRFAMQPLANFDQMLRFFGSKNVDGRGYLWNRFMSGFTAATDKEWKNKQAAQNELSEKLSKIMGKKMRITDVFSMMRKMPTVSVQFWDSDARDNSKREDKDKKTYELTQGNLLYIYMVNKMSDGRMKLRKMGISEQDVANITKLIDPRFIEFADWLQNDYLVRKRNEYNEVHQRMFGASMAAIENYFPLVINSRSRNVAEKIEEQKDDNARPSTITGSIIKRVRNSVALDLTNADAFAVILDHVDQMERWAAFAEFNRDLNALLSYKRFRNRVLNMSSARFGAGTTLWKNFKDTCAIAAGVYRPKGGSAIDATVLNLAKGVTASKIAFRLWTAVKQVLSVPAFATEANTWEFIKAFNPTNMADSWNWAIEELPTFAKRWQSRQAGDSRLRKTDLDWGFTHTKILETATRIGMSPNAFVDALACVVGAKAIYETKYKRYLKQGYNEAQAKQKALDDASVAFNETQQSSEDAYLSAMQVDRTVASVALSVFRNSNMAYTRRLMHALSNLKRRLKEGYNEESIAFMAKQMMREGGLTETQANANATKAYNQQGYKDIADVVLFGIGLKLMWELGSYLPYLIMGDDDEEKKQIVEDALVRSIAGPIEGLAGGDIVADAISWKLSGKGFYGYSFGSLPLMDDIQNTLSKFDSDKVAAINDVLNILVASTTGVNPQTLTDTAVAIIDAVDADPVTSKEVAMLIMRIMQVPQSQIDEIYIDELGMNAREVRDLNPYALAHRYAEYKRKKAAPITGIFYDKEGKEKADKKYVKRFNKMRKERIENAGDPHARKIIEEYENDEFLDTEALSKEINAQRKESESEYFNRYNRFRVTPEYKRYQTYKQKQKEIDKAIKEFDWHRVDQLRIELADELSKSYALQTDEDAGK